MCSSSTLLLCSPLYTTILLLLSPQLITAQNESGVAAGYIIDVYKSIDVPMIGNSPPTNKLIPAGRYIPPTNYPYIAYPLKRCSRNGNDFSSGGASKHIRYQCDSTASGIYRCIHGTDTTCGSAAPTACDAQFDGYSVFIPTTPYTFGDGACNGIPTLKGSTTQYYMQVNYYKAYTDSNAGCPGIPFNSTTYIGFEYVTNSKFATGICVAQDNGKYIMTKCNVNAGDISLYNDALCTALNQTLISYDTQCEYYSNPMGLINSPRYFRRFAECVVNGIDIVVPTPSPTMDPSQSPTTSEPSIAPSKTPSESPVTSAPSESPSNEPSQTPSSGTPTTTPSAQPSHAPTTPRPTKAPVTLSPTDAPSEAAEEKLEGLELLTESAKTISLIQIIIISLFVLYLCIGCYVWCHERNKRLKILNPGKKGRMERITKARERNQQKRLQMESLQKNREALQSRSTNDQTVLNQDIIR